MYIFLLYFDHVNTALVSIRDFFQYNEIKTLLLSVYMHNVVLNCNNISQNDNYFERSNIFFFINF